MTDEELERALGRQRVVGPPSTLRARVLDSATGKPVRVRLGIFDYATAALAAGLVLFATMLDAPVPTSGEARRQRETLAVAAALGGGPDAMQYAEFVVSRGSELDDAPVMESPW